MGGLAGHMMHLYDDSSMKIGDLRSFVDNLFSGGVDIKSVTEKTDGQNLFASWDGKKFIAGRNISQVKSGGVPLGTLKKLWPNIPSVQAAFTNGFQAFIRAGNSLGKDELARLDELNKLFDNGNNWINMEIMYPANSNSISYDTKAIQFHGIQKWNPEKKRMEPVESPEFEKFKKKVVTGIKKRKNEWSVLGPIYKKLENNSKEISNANSKLNNVIKQAGISNSNTIGDYIKKRLEMILTEFGVTGDDLNELIIRVFEGKNPRKPHLTSYPALKGYTAAKIRRMAIEPLEDFIGYVSFIVLKNLSSSLMVMPADKAKSMDGEVRSVMNTVKSNLGKSHADYKWLEKELSKISKFTSFYAQTIEGLAIQYGGKLYKLTGFFAPINQILGSIKYGRIKLESVAKLVEDNRVKTVAIYPGAFKPPHAGHFDVVRRAAKVADVVYVIGSTKTRDGISGNISKDVWEKFYIPKLGNKVKFVPAPVSPVKTTYDFLEDLDADSVLFAGDEDIARFKNISKFVKTGYVTKVQPIPRSTIPISGTEFRNAIRAGDDLSKFIPNLSTGTKKKLISYLKTNIK